MRVFVDSSYYIAWLIPRDQWFRAAVRASRPGLDFVTSSAVINEVISLLQSRGQLSPALAFLERIRREEVQIVYPDSALQEEAWRLFGKWAGMGANAVDCLSFAIMHQLGIRKAFTFDQHFRAAGFEILHG